MPKTVKSTITPLIVGATAVGLLRQWRMLDHAVLEDWLGIIRNAIKRDAAEGENGFEAHHLDEHAGYEAWAEHYDGFNPLIAREQPVLESLIEPVSKGRALDAACGTGRVSALLAQRGYAVVGIDQSEAMMARARAKVPEATFKTGQLEALPVEDAAFDVAVSCLAITHSEPAAVFRELARAVKTGGRVIFSEAHPFNVLLGARPSFPLDGDGAMGMVSSGEHSMGEYIAAINAAGLNIAACHEPGFRDEDIETLFGPFEERYGPGFVDANKAGLRGFPMAVIWDLRKPD